MDNIIYSLKILGLSHYEAEAYISLNKLISAKADEISELANIPRTKVYYVLKELDKKGFIKIDHGTRPLTYTVIPPFDVYNNKKEELIKKLNESGERLNEIYNNQINETQAPVWLINSSKNIVNKELELIKESKKSIYIKIGFLFENEDDDLINTLKKLSNEIQIKIILNNKINANGRNENIYEKFKNSKLSNLEIIERNLPPTKLLIIDGKELLRTFIKVDDDNLIIPNTEIGIWNKYEEISKNYSNMFIDDFYKLKEDKK
ncbi:MAG: TrmB family transcriptional regulator [Methanobrevibacter sp.]